MKADTVDNRRFFTLSKEESAGSSSRAATGHRSYTLFSQDQSKDRSSPRASGLPRMRGAITPPSQSSRDSFPMVSSEEDAGRSDALAPVHTVVEGGARKDVTVPSSDKLMELAVYATGAHVGSLKFPLGDMRLPNLEWEFSLTI